jgi:hypothetical protein
MLHCLLSEDTDDAESENNHLRVFQSETQHYLEVMRKITQNDENVSRITLEYDHKFQDWTTLECMYDRHHTYIQYKGHISALSFSLIPVLNYCTYCINDRV